MGSNRLFKGKDIVRIWSIARLAADTASPVYEFVKPLEEKGITNV